MFKTINILKHDLIFVLSIDCFKTHILLIVDVISSIAHAYVLSNKLLKD